MIFSIPKACARYSTDGRENIEELLSRNFESISDRVVFDQLENNKLSHLRRFAAMDLLLDTPAYNGGATSESLF